MGLLRTSVLATNPLSSGTGDASPAEQQKGQSFVTLQSLSSFSGFTAAITIVWKILASLGVDTKFVPLIASFLVGVVLWLDSIAGVPKQRPTQLLLGLFIALVNAAAVYLAVIGADATLDQAGVADTTNPDVEISN